MPYLMNQSPRWLDYSGLPQNLHQEISPCAWFVFKRLMELDILSNLEPDVFKESIENISQTLGLQAQEIRDTVIQLMEKGWIECYLPETDSELAYFKINIPIPTPISPLQIPIEQGGLQGSSELIRLRYYTLPQYDENENKFKQILHLYYDLCGLKLNSLVLDDLKEIERQFDLEKIKFAFEKAKKNKARSLRPVFHILYGKEVKSKKNKKNSAETVNSET